VPVPRGVLLALVRDVHVVQAPVLLLQLLKPGVKTFFSQGAQAGRIVNRRKALIIVYAKPYGGSQADAHGVQVTALKCRSIKPWLELGLGEHRVVGTVRLPNVPLPLHVRVLRLHAVLSRLLLLCRGARLVLLRALWFK
jgi:hypothetical protein